MREDYMQNSLFKSSATGIRQLLTSQLLNAHEQHHLNNRTGERLDDFGVPPT